MDNSTTTDGSALGAAGPLPPVSADYKINKSVYASTITMCIIAAAAVAARFYTRVVIRKVIGAEDYCILVAFLLAIGAGVAQIKEADYGLGNHVMELPPDTFKLQLRSSWVSILFYQLSLTFSKFSVCLLYVRIFNYHFARTAAWCLLAIVAIYTTAGTINTFVVCIPLQAYWDFSITDKKCQTGLAGLWAFVGLNIATDVLIFTLPIPVVWKMNLPIRQKLGVLFIFALGFFVCLVSIVRAIIINTVTTEAASDPSHAFIDIANWTSVEVFTAVIVPCLVVLKPLITNIWPSFGRSSRNEGLEANGAIVTVGGSGGDASTGKGSATARSGPGADPWTPVASAAEKNSLDDTESPAGASDRSHGVGMVELAGSDGVGKVELAGSGGVGKVELSG